MESRGCSRADGFTGAPYISRIHSGITGPPPSIGLALPSKVRPSISEDREIFIGSPLNLTCVSSVSRSLVPLNTWTIALVVVVSSTWPIRTSPPGRVISAISPYPIPSTPSSTISGPTTFDTPVYVRNLRSFMCLPSHFLSTLYHGRWS
ncbi:MAG: hypothetical protein BWY05_00634 [Euryarchaeota archaeon ADurb.Bin165]|nr:MAG: hypothetical protein BWY05_00634 [Euryarchaeota archaeon ADurb.Bin165]